MGVPRKQQVKTHSLVVLSGVLGLMGKKNSRSFFGCARKGLDGIGQLASEAPCPRIRHAAHDKGGPVVLDGPPLVSQKPYAERRNLLHPTFVVKVVLVIAFDRDDSVPCTKSSERSNVLGPDVHLAVDEVARDDDKIGREAVDSCHEILHVGRAQKRRRMQVGELHDPHALKSRRQVLDRNRHLLDAGNPESLPKTEGRNADGRGRHADRHAPVLLHEAMHTLSRTAGQNGQKDDDLAKQREACKHGEREDAAVAGGQHPGGQLGANEPAEERGGDGGKGGDEKRHNKARDLHHPRCIHRKPEAPEHPERTDGMKNCKTHGEPILSSCLGLAAGKSCRANCP